MTHVAKTMVETQGWGEDGVERIPLSGVRAGDVGEGKLVEVDLHLKEVDGASVLLGRSRGKLFAMGNKCTHYAASLKGGVLSEGRVRCPWHGACFSVTTGDIEDSPGSDGVHTFPIIEDSDGSLSVMVRIEQFSQWRRVPSCSAPNPADAVRTVVVVGGGAGGHSAAETLRLEGFGGRIILLCREKTLPYDRPKLSKALSVDVDRILLRPEAFYEKHRIEVELGARVSRIDVTLKNLTLDDGRCIAYDDVVLATGGDPRLLPVPGADLAHIWPLREPREAAAIAGAFANKHVVIVGSSFIGMETAALMAASGKAASIAVVGMEAVPFERVLGVRIGEALQKMHEDKGVVFYMKRVVSSFSPAAGRPSDVGSVLLDNGVQLPADVVVIGAGCVPATTFAKDAISLQRDGSIKVSASMAVEGAPHVYAVGDIARYPYFLHAGGGDGSIRVEHWAMAQYQGRTAARAILGHPVSELACVPFFWTVMYGKSLRYAGHALAFDDVLLHGDFPSKFVAFYYKGQEVLAVATIGMDPVAVIAAELFQFHKMPSLDVLKQNPNLETYLK